MKNSLLNLAVISTLGVISVPAFAAGSLQPLVSAPTGSAYINCYNDGRVIPPLAGPATTALLARSNFGSTTLAGSSGVCEITGLANETTAPLPGYGLQVTSSTQSIPNAAGTATIGTVVERIWRKPAATAPVTATNMCIIGTKVTLTNTLYDTTLFELNDIARGGYSSISTVNVGYFALAASPAPSPVYRAGRTFTSVQHRSYIYGGGTVAERQNNGTGFVDLPPIGGSLTLNINGDNTPLLPNVIATAVTSTQQQAQINANWVDFSLDAAAVDDDGGSNPSTSMTYVEFPCNNDTAGVMNTVAASGSTAGWRKAGALRLRRTAQENTTFAEITLTGYAPPGAVLP